MDEQRKQVIINEINFWKQNNMLPEHYCDYLLAIYTKGNKEDEHAKQRKRSFIITEIYFNVLFLLMIFCSIVYTFIFPLSFTYQLILYACLNFILLIIYYVIKKWNEEQLPVFITAAFLLLIFEVQLNDFLFMGNVKILYLLLLLNSCIWIFIGIKKKMKLFLISGIVTIPVVLFFLFTR